MSATAQHLSPGEPVFTDADDLRHRAPDGGRMRDSLFWNLIVPEEHLAMQVYLFINHRGRTGYNVCVWGGDREPLVEQHMGEVGPEANFDDWEDAGLRLRQPEVRRSAELAYRSERVALEYRFDALHDAFSYRENPEGLPAWFAANRFEQAGRVTGTLTVDGRPLEFDRIAHRDHSWGPRNWGYPQHWKWLLAHTPSGRALNGFIWIAEGEWGFNGYVLRDGRPVAIERFTRQAAEYDERMDHSRLDAEIRDVEGETTTLVLDSFGMVRMPHHDAYGTIIMEAGCRAEIDGEPGGGQFETHWPVSYLEHLAAARAQ
jgi:hypothetical protein